MTNGAVLLSLELGRTQHPDYRISYLKESQPEPGEEETGVRLLEERTTSLVSLPRLLVFKAGFFSKDKWGSNLDLQEQLHILGCLVINCGKNAPL